ncbi:hypothetical protein SAMN05216223_106457 [Actinacidiphila yanglinensis]|uniref:Uncharacterized protein n=1 Tax=Actinacidiphila yanglinensis TaxID=310779 RepID=A0A1H6BDX8_9ACTN|nr:hypothetical protein [Actinacidiphila yanglinensis]SEG58754.1 hypothetical protein SAMN05216223_106457 [Actinacidiphila yanglinensis]
MSEGYDLPGLAPEPGFAPPADPSGQPPAVAEPDRGPVHLGVTVDTTGNAEVDAVVERLRDADALPTDAHIEVYEDVHAGLRNALTALDENRG